MFREIFVTLILWQIQFGVSHKFTRESFVLEPPIPQQKSNRTPELEFVMQRLDNFDPTNTETWQMVRIIGIPKL